MVLDHVTVGEYLTRHGWRYDSHDEELIVTGFRTQGGAFRVFVQIAEPWLLFAIVPFVPQPIPECREPFYEYAMRLNFEMNLAKLGIDGDGDVSLSLELRAEDLSYEGFGAALEALAYYADTWHEPLMALGTDPHFDPPPLS